MQIAKSRRTLRINSGCAGPEGRKEDPREIGKSKCRATAAALARLIYLMGPSSLLNYFWKPLNSLSNFRDDANDLERYFHGKNGEKLLLHGKNFFLEFILNI